MKIRNGFISNSSSCSFTINKNNLTQTQNNLIHNHINSWSDFYTAEERAQMYCPKEYDRWSITEMDDKIMCETSMNNFDMEDFLQRIGVTSQLEDYYHS